MTEFRGFPKIPRYSRECVITEKIDGTNASVIIVRADGQESLPGGCAVVTGAYPEIYTVTAGSRNRLICPTDDNHGFAAWVWEHAEELVRGLGGGVHFGEWWGCGINRGYGLQEKRFSLFNTTRWGEARPACCHVVPVIERGIFHSWLVERAIEKLHADGSAAAPGFKNPEGVVIYHTAGNLMFKKTLHRDEEWKGKR